MDDAARMLAEGMRRQELRGLYARLDELLRPAIEPLSGPTPGPVVLTEDRAAEILTILNEIGHLNRQEPSSE